MNCDAVLSLNVHLRLFNYPDWLKIFSNSHIKYSRNRKLKFSTYRWYTRYTMLNACLYTPYSISVNTALYVNRNYSTSLSKSVTGETTRKRNI